MSPTANHPDLSQRGKLPTRPSTQSAQKNSESAQHGRRPGIYAMLFGLFGAVAVWFLQTEFGETLVAQVCFRHDAASLTPQWLLPAVSAATAFALLIGIAGVGVAWRNWRVTRNVCASVAQHALDTSKGRQHFLAMAGFLLSLLFLVGLVAAGLAVLLVSPCSAWR